MVNALVAADVPRSAGGGAWLGLSVILAVLAAGLAIDPGAQSAYAAPKRLLVLAAVFSGLLALLWRPGPAGVAWSGSTRWLVVVTLLLAAWLVLATLLAPQPFLVLEPLRHLGLMAGMILLGAATAWSPPWRVRLLWLALAVCAGNAAISLLQAMDLNPVPIDLARLGGRYPSIGLLGNEGYVALASALAGCAALALSSQQGLPPRHRLLAGGTLVLLIAAIVVNRQLTSLAALLGGALLLACVQLRWRWAIRTAAAGLALVVATAAVPALQRTTWGQLGTLDDWQQRTTWRVSAWATALEMTAQRPWLGQGPGTFERESQKFRLAAELRWRQRLPPPVTANAFGEAHNEFLELAAEAGVPALLLALLGLGLLLDRLLRRAIDQRDVESRLLLAVLAGGSVAALAWFPLQVPLTATLLLLALGRAWRVLASPEPVR